MSDSTVESAELPRNRACRFSRRGFLLGSAATIVAGTSYSYFEAGWIRVQRQTISVPNLPEPFRGRKFALLADIHHGTFVSLDYVQSVVALTNELEADAILLAGDYVHRHSKYIEPCFDVLRNLQAPLGIFGVMGNHDHREGLMATRAAMQKNGIEEVTNSGVWVQEQGKRLRIAGVDDLLEAKQNLKSALSNVGQDETSILLNHNPDYVEQIKDKRVGLVVSGHTHGGQVVVPFLGAPRVPSRYGQKYLHGLVKTDFTQVFVSRGIGTVTPPLRFYCRPEVVLITVV